MSGTSINHLINHSRIFLASLLNGSVSSKRADLTAVSRSSGVEGPRLPCAIAVRQNRRQNAEVKSVRTTTVISILSSLCFRKSKRSKPSSEDYAKDCTGPRNFPHPSVRLDAPPYCSRVRRGLLVDPIHM